MTPDKANDIASRIKNPAWDAIQKIPHDDLLGRMHSGFSPTAYGDPRKQEFIGYRSRAVGLWSWAIPSTDSIAYILQILNGRSVVELGAGSGYLAWLLDQCGVNVNAYDIAPIGHEGSWFVPRTEKVDGADVDPVEWFPVKQGSVEVLDEAENRCRVLLLCWPNYDTSFAHDAVKAFRGSTVIYIGEGSGGCNADGGFFELMEGSSPYSWGAEDDDYKPVPQEWTPIEMGPLVQWAGLHDHLVVYERNPK